MRQDYVLVGAGGTGTHLLAPLVRYLISHHQGIDSDVWQLGVIDGDQIELKNLARQLFNPNSIARNKAHEAVTPYEYMGTVVAAAEYLGVNNIEKFLRDGVTVLIAVDNYPVRALIEKHCLTLDNAVVINGGNEIDSGSCQLWVRKDGVNVTPPISFLHPEILMGGEDRAAMTCAQIAALPGGEQTITANMMSASWMLTALSQVNKPEWTEIQFTPYNVIAMDHRERVGWY